MASASQLPPLPPPTVQLATSNGQVAQGYAQYLSQLDTQVRSGNFPALSVNGSAALTVAGNQSLVGGFQETPFAIAQPANGGTITPNPSDNLKQTVTNNGAFTIAATAEVGDVELLITNGASAGAVSFSGFNKAWTGDALDATSGHSFVVFIYGLPNGLSAYLIKALQ
jgi:hypothetical protein